MVDVEIISIDEKIWERYPSLKVGILVARGIDNSRDDDQILQLLRKSEHDSKNKYSQTDLGNVGKLVDWREAYRSFGYKPSAARCSCEALLRRALKDKQLPDISAVVNLYNALSLKHTLCMGADDLDNVDGCVRLTIARGDEQFCGIGGTTTELARAGEVVYRDDKEITSKAWNYRECDKSKVTKQTKDVAIVIEGLENTSLGEVAQALKELHELIERFCGGSFEMHLLDFDVREMGENALLENRTIPIEIPEPEYHKHEAFQVRKGKLEEILEAGIDPYPAKFEPSHSAKNALEMDVDTDFETASAASGDEIALAGRLVLFRAMGTNIFGQILDETHRIQVVFNRDHTQVEGVEKPLKFIEKKLDLGDIIGVKGHLFRTQTGEMTLFVKECTLLCKTLLPLPDKHKGLSDKGTRYRKRWLDLITHTEVGEHFRLRSSILVEIRKYFEEFDFLEVETPTLQNIYGGAAAKPFVTHHNALSQDMYCRIALEIALKKLVVGGMNRVYEIGKVFRNEGIDRTHNPEFTMLEAYSAYWDYNDVMEFIENLYERLAIKIFGKTNIGKREDKHGNSHEIDLKAPWIRLSMKDAIKTYGKIDVDQLSDDEIKHKLESKVAPEKLIDTPRGNLIAMLFEEYAEEHLIQPHHIIDHPIETTPLCKPHRDPKLRKEGLVERFESFILGVECCNAYTELNDPVLQRSLLEEQAQLRDSGDDEACPMDEEFIEAICQGMPPAGGLGIGIDRLCMLFTGVHSIRDVLFFPVMRPEE